MNAGPLLDAVVAALAAVRLEAILIGNAAAAIQGAPVTTVDFDFMFRPTVVNLAKLKKTPPGWMPWFSALTILYRLCIA